jgi:hypothetical protein
MPVFAVLYEYLDDSVDARDAHRAAHRAFLDTLVDPVKLLASGPWAADPAGALLVFEAASAAEVETALDNDPFAVEGLVGHRQVREWSQARGPWVTD